MLARPWSDDSAGLLIMRPLSTADDLLRSYTVVVDGKRRAELRYGEAVELSVATGSHTVYATLSSDSRTTETQRLEVSARAGHRTPLAVEPSAPSTAIRKATDEWIVITELARS